MTWLRRWTLALVAALALLSVACDPDPTPDDGGPDGGPVVTPDGGPRFDAGPTCETDEDCDDGIACTTDSCGDNGLCRNITDATVCDDNIFCNGAELCDPRAGGCVPGPRQTCNDSDVCTIDRCDEEDSICLHTPRDLDEDGDPDFFCEGGGDCDDVDPTVNSLLNEVCDDRVDNDCDGTVDEAECGRPRYDICDEPLDVSEGGFFLLDSDGAAPDYTLPCRETSPTTRDLVATFTIEGENRSVELIAEGDFSSVALDLRTACEDRETSLECRSGFPGVIRFPSLAAGTYFVIIGTTGDQEISLEVSFGEPIEPPENDTCATPTDVSAGGTFMGTFVATADDTATQCGAINAPDVFYRFDTTGMGPQNVEISAQSLSGTQTLSYSVRSACGDSGTELRCAAGAPAAGTLHELPEGEYFIVVEGPATEEVEYQLQVAFSAPTPAAAGDSCATALPLEPGVDATGTFLGFENDHAVSCGTHYNDIVYTFTLEEAADVTLELDTAVRGAISIRTDCADGTAPSQLRCTAGDPVVQRVRGLGAGTYFVVVESSTAAGYTLSLDVTTPPSVPVDVVGNNTCGGAHVIPPTGGFFRGDTSALANTYLASMCGGNAASRDAAFSLTLTERSRVVASTQDSSYDTVLHVHQTVCMSNGDEFCNDNGIDGTRSLIDQNLDPGTWFFIVDGFGAASAGEYFLEVTVTPL